MTKLPVHNQNTEQHKTRRIPRRNKHSQKGITENKHNLHNKKINRPRCNEHLT